MKLTDKQVQQVLIDYNDMSLACLSAKYKVTKSAILYHVNKHHVNKHHVNKHHVNKHHINKCHSKPKRGPHKLTVKQIMYLRNEYAKGEITQTELSKKYKISPSAVFYHVNKDPRTQYLPRTNITRPEPRKPGRTITRVRDAVKIKKTSDDQSRAACYNAVRRDGLSLSLVRRQTAKIRKAAVQQNGLALQYADKITLDLCKDAIWQNPLAKQFVPKKFLNKI